MKISSFYKIYYRHRILKASYFLKLYLILTMILKFLVNYLFFIKKKDLDKISKKYQFLFEKNLNYLFEYFNSDKGEQFVNQYLPPIKRKNLKIRAHGYAKFYENYFKNIKNKELKIIEIGSFYGNASAALYFYFKNSIIFSADINPDMYIYKSKRIKNFFIDNSSRSSIDNNLVNKNIKFDIVIEDASHMLNDQIISLFMIFKILKPGGLFFIEEIDFPEKRADMRTNQIGPDLKEILNKIMLNKDFFSPYITKIEKDYFLKNHEYIKFFSGNFNEIVVIKKKFN